MPNGLEIKQETQDWLDARIQSVPHATMDELITDLFKYNPHGHHIRQVERTKIRDPYKRAHAERQLQHEIEWITSFTFR